MKLNLSASFKLGIGLLAIALCLFSAATSQAAALIWDPGFTASGGGGGVGAWDGTGATTNWYDGVSSDVGWTSGGNAEFDNTAGTVTATGVTVQNMTFNSGYTLVPAATSSLILAGTTPTITVNGAMVTIGVSGAGGAGPVAGTVGLTKDGTGTLFLDGRGANNTYSGGTTVLNGTLQINRDLSLGVAPSALDLNNVVLKDGATLSVQTTTSGTGNNRGIRLDGNATFISPSGTLGWGGPITGTGTFNIKATGTVRFPGGWSIYSGDTVIQSGTLSQTTLNALPYKSNPNNNGGGTLPGATGAGTGDVYIWSGATLYNNKLAMQINGLNDGVATGHGAGTVSFDAGNSRTLTLGDNNANGSFSGTIIGSTMSLTKIGAGTQTLSGANTYGQATTISAGTLKLTGAGSLASTLIDVAGGTFDVSTVTGGYTFGGVAVTAAEIMRGTGTVSGAMTLLGSSTVSANTASLSPGETGASAVGTLNVGSVTFGNNSVLNIDLGSAALYDALSSSGTLNFQTGSIMNVSLVSGYTPAGGETYHILAAAGGETGSFTTLNLPSLAPGLSWDTSNLISSGSISVVLVPEPATLSMLLMVLAMGGFVMLKRRCN